MMRHTLPPFLFFLVIIHCCYGQQYVVDKKMHHLRNGEVQEWSAFPIKADHQELLIRFSGNKNDNEQTLYLRQYDVKLNWRILINDHDIGSLVTDEKDLIAYYKIPSGILQSGDNHLQIKTADAVSDDIMVGEIVLDNRPVTTLLSEATVKIDVFDEQNVILPSHITIVNDKGALQTVSAEEKEHLAIRPGNVYTANGKASFSMPAGTYTIYAGRGFEYGIDSVKLVLKTGDRFHKKIILKREVPTEGWISSDTHIHTYTHSGHGDATDKDRVITIAGEGVELPVITDHNAHIDLQQEALANGVRKYFTPVVGNEVTTKVGHFNIFPITPGETVADHRAEDWNSLSNNIKKESSEKAIILNHARDIHIGFRPHDPKLFISAAGMRKDHEKFFANAMEVLNSGSQQTDIMQLFRDWFAMLNHGQFITPVGSSDSHDVSRFIVGQGRTYVRSDDQDPGKINVEQAVKNFLQGKVMVSAGLLTEITVNEKFGPGDVVSSADEITVSVRVLGPGWTKAERVTIYANGIKIREESIKDGTVSGVKWADTWQLNLPKHDIFLVAIAEGPGNNMPFWSIAKPFQHESPEWQPKVIGSTGAVWIDADKNGKRNCAYDYASELFSKTKTDPVKLVRSLAVYDQAIAVQAAVLLWQKGNDLREEPISRALRNAPPATREGFRVVIEDLYQE